MRASFFLYFILSAALFLGGKWQEESRVWRYFLAGKSKATGLVICLMAGEGK